MRCGLAGAAGLLLAGRQAVGAAAGAKPPKAKAKSVIQIWAAGGPPHLDTFDPKPDAGNDYCGPLNNPIATNVDGIRIGELLIVSDCFQIQVLIPGLFSNFPGYNPGILHHGGIEFSFKKVQIVDFQHVFKRSKCAFIII